MPLLFYERLWWLVVGALLVGAVAAFWPVSGHDVRLLGLGGLIVSFYVALIIRELSRLAACRLIGWDVYLLRIWPFLVRFEPFAVRLGTIPGKFDAGWVLAFPPTPEKQTKWRVAIFNRAGAVANFICVVAIMAPLALYHHHGVVPAGFVILAMALFLVAISSLQTGQKNEPLSPFGVAHLKALGLRASGIMPGQWDAALVATLAAGAGHGGAETEANLRSADIFLYEHYFDSKDYKKARQALDRASSRTSPSDKMWYGLCIEDAFFSAFIERDIARAEQSLAKVDDAKLRRHYPYRQALAAIAIARGDGREALRLLGRKQRDRDPFSGLYHQQIHMQVVREAHRLLSSQ